MPGKFQLTIPKPCHEQWSDFTPTQQGGFCHSCQKEVIDFTNWSEEQLKAYFRNASSGTCGRFREEQLKVYRDKQNKPVLLRWLPVALTSLLLIAARQSYAQKQKAIVEQIEPDLKTGEIASVEPDSSIVVRGVITDEQGALMPGVTVHRNGTSQQTESDHLGNFAITIRNPNPSDIIAFDFTAMKTSEYQLLTDKPHQYVHVVLKNNITALTAATKTMWVLGGAVSVQHSWYNPTQWRLTIWDWLR